MRSSIRLHSIRIGKLRDKDDPVFEMCVADMPGLLPRTASLLEQRGVWKVRELINMKVSHLLAIGQFGPGTVNEIFESLAHLELIEIIDDSPQE